MQKITYLNKYYLIDIDNGVYMDQKRIVVFIGPSLTLNDARKILDAEFHPPVARGDIAALLNDPPDIIGIIDGVFHQQPAVSHREILQAMEAGVTVIGGSSMGALRAAELDNDGMIGIGKVYQNYRDGKIESDDDVAIVFDPVNHELLSEALVSMSYNFQMAEKMGIITTNDFKILYSLSRAINPSINKVLANLDYKYCGRLVNNCHICGDFEDMNIWVKKLKNKHADL